MKINEFIRILLKADPEEEVNVEASLLESVENKFQNHKFTYPLDLFIEEEIPFRLSDSIGLDETEIEQIKDKLLDKFCIGRGGEFNFFDNDGFDKAIKSVLDECNIQY